MKEQDNIFYVYAHYRASGSKKDEIFYVGKGCGYRAYVKADRSNYWKHIVNKHDYYVEILYDNLDEQTAFSLEIATIARYGRKDLKLGPLVNMTDGGDTGPLMYTSVKNNIGEVFPSVSAAAAKYNLLNGTGIAQCCQGEALSSGIDPISETPLQWKYFEDNTPFQKYIDPRNCPVKNQFGLVFDSAPKAAEFYNMSTYSGINKCCRGVQKSSGKCPESRQPLQWKYENDPVPFDTYVSNLDWSSIPVVNQFGDVFPSAPAAAKWCGLANGSNINSCCRCKEKSSGRHPITGVKLFWNYFNN